MALHIYAQLDFTEQLALYLVQKFNLSKMYFEEFFEKFVENLS